MYTIGSFDNTVSFLLTFRLCKPNNNNYYFNTSSVCHFYVFCLSRREKNTFKYFYFWISQKILLFVLLFLISEKILFVYTFILGILGKSFSEYFYFCGIMKILFSKSIVVFLALKIYVPTHRCRSNDVLEILQFFRITSKLMKFFKFFLCNWFRNALNSQKNQVSRDLSSQN